MAATHRLHQQFVVLHLFQYREYWCGVAETRMECRRKRIRTALLLYCCAPGQLRSGESQITPIYGTVQGILPDFSVEMAVVNADPSSLAPKWPLSRTASHKTVALVFTEYVSCTWYRQYLAV